MHARSCGCINENYLDQHYYSLLVCFCYVNMQVARIIRRIMHKQVRIGLLIAYLMITSLMCSNHRTVVILKVC